MTTSHDRGAWPVPGLGLVAGAALALLVSVLVDWPLALAVPVGAALGLVVGAAVAAARSPDTRS